MRILVVEDDQRLSNLLVKGLRENAYAVDHAGHADQALELAAVNEYDGIVLDVGLPGQSGIAVCKTLRKDGVATPILMLTARDAIQDRVTGLDAGADDYLTKPFDFTELLARLRALLRRSPAIQPAEIHVADLIIHTGSQRVSRAGEAIEVTAKEFALLEYLARRQGEVVSRADITAHVWDENHDPASNTLEVYINRLRRKVDRPEWPPLIHTRRGAGYLLGAASDD